VTTELHPNVQKVRSCTGATPCPASLCALIRDCVQPSAVDECAITYVRRTGVGREVAADADVHCGNCGVPRWTPGSGVWRNAWAGRPHCGICLAEDVDELAGLLGLLAEAIDEEEPWP